MSIDIYEFRRHLAITKYNSKPRIGIPALAYSPGRHRPTRALASDSTPRDSNLNNTPDPYQAEPFWVYPPKLRASYTYDYMGRRVRTFVEKNELFLAGVPVWETESDTRYVYDGWNVVPGAMSIHRIDMLSRAARGTHLRASMPTYISSLLFRSMTKLDVTRGQGQR